MESEDTASLLHSFNFDGWYFESFSNGTLASEAFKEKQNPTINFPTMSFPDNYIYIKCGAFELRLDCIKLLGSVEKGHWTFNPVLSFEGFAEEEGAEIDYERLKDTSIPILHYTRVLFYEDEVNDCGQVQVQAQLRVMPFGFFLLLRHYFKLDSQLTPSLTEYRIYHAFDDQRIILEVTEDKNKVKYLLSYRL